MCAYYHILCVLISCAYDVLAMRDYYGTCAYYVRIMCDDYGTYAYSLICAYHE